MKGALRLAWRLQRAELLFCLGLCACLTVAALWLAFDMRSKLVGCGTAQAATACEFTFPFQQSHGSAVQMLQLVIGLVPYGVGLVLGVPLVAREVEHKTALIAWPLAGSRRRWLAWRAGPVLLSGVALVAIIAFAADQVNHAYLPTSDLGFLMYDGRGLPLVMRALVALVLGAAVGALIGRVLPALLVGIALSVAISTGLGAVLDKWVPPRELSAEQSPMNGVGGVLTTDLRYRLPDGRVVDAQKGEIMAEAILQASGDAEPDPAILPQPIFSGVAADRYGEVLVRESLALGAAALLLSGLAAAIVGRRRPE